MLNFLFPRLTPARGSDLFASITDVARRPHWYESGGAADTIDGRFRVLATLTALALVRLDQLGAAGEAGSVALTERFVEVMEAEHRELGLGDPTLGKTVRKLVGALGKRVALWRGAVSGSGIWDDVAAESLAGTAHSSGALREFWQDIARLGVEELMEGRLH